MKNDEPEICASISTKRMYLNILRIQEKILETNNINNKKEILNYINNIQHDIQLINDIHNHIERDIYA